MKTIYATLLLTLVLNAQTLQETIDYSIQNNYQLQILDEEASIVHEQKAIEGLWDDPILRAGINDLQSDKPFSRNVEAMQNQFIGLSQTIPLSNKLEVASQIEGEKIKLLEQRAEALKVNIAFGIRKAFITAENSKSTLNILDDYIRFLNTPMNLLINLSAVERKSILKRNYFKSLISYNVKMQYNVWALPKSK